MRRRFFAVLGVVLPLAWAGTGAAVAAPPPPLAPTSVHVAHIDALSPTRSAVFVDSPAMGRTVQVQVLHPANNSPRPSFYLLDGVESGTDESTWTKKTDIVRFFQNKNVNVVLPVGGTGSYYTDWQKPDPILGVNKWETFLTKELPPIIDGDLDGNGVNSIGGLSMGGQSALALITRHPDLYRGVAAYSACPSSTDPNAKSAIRATVASRGGNADNMWGPDDNPDWVSHDPSTNAEKLRGKSIYLDVGNGLPGPYELLPGADTGTAVIQGGPLEAAARTCTVQFQQRLAQLKIPARFNFRPYGTHSWPYWQDALHVSWPTVAASLGD
ncbi:alpha/beta hydrolase [Antrihabitans cavernicola]|uniref:Esterase family protein n=1 Tax=Antrihabitans cavernicola TaxID=2495913 RepID=A0A5A7SER4_9NOCA|nr:alpha/beta hydrolase family protein [Spelaeibacter cavernicola]KAA0024588.1 esterase family protein [Spelaeibacter cavernicola]